MAKVVTATTPTEPGVPPCPPRTDGEAKPVPRRGVYFSGRGSRNRAPRPIVFPGFRDERWPESSSTPPPLAAAGCAGRLSSNRSSRGLDHTRAPYDSSIIVIITRPRAHAPHPPTQPNPVRPPRLCLRGRVGFGGLVACRPLPARNGSATRQADADAGVGKFERSGGKGRVAVALGTVVRGTPGFVTERRRGGGGGPALARGREAAQLAAGPGWAPRPETAAAAICARLPAAPRRFGRPPSARRVARACLLRILVTGLSVT